MRDVLNFPPLAESYSKIFDSIRTLDKTLFFNSAISHRIHLCFGLGEKLYYITTEERIGLSQELFSQYGCKTLSLPSVYDVVIHRRGMNLSQVGKRINVLHSLLHGDYDVLLTTPKALLQYLPLKSVFEKSFIELKVGDLVDIDELSDRLIKMGYNKLPHAEEKCSFAVIGEILEIFTIDSELPARILFDFDEVSTIKYFHPDTMQGANKVESISIPPSSDLLSDIDGEEVLSRIKKSRMLQNPRASQRTEEIISDISLKLTKEAIEPSMVWVIPFINDRLSTIFDYLPENGVIAIDEPEEIFDYISLTLKTHSERVKKLVQEGEALRKHSDSILSLEKLNKYLSQFRQIGFSNSNIGLSGIDKGIFIANSTSIPPYFKDMGLMLRDVSEYVSKGYTVKIFCGNESNENILKSFLGDIKVEYIPYKLNRGFIEAGVKLLVCGMQDLCLTSEGVKTVKSRRHSIAPRVGDYVVHQEYGIGKCLGVKHEKTYVGEKDYILLEYAGGDRVMVPVQQMDILELYAGAESNPKLSNIGNDEFSKHKAKAKQSIKKLAFDLLELYAKREKSIGYKYPVDGPFQLEFERAFEFKETPDQERAIADIKRDMESGKVMDRLICGDVGFGKTEVALRAIFKTVCENKQVAFLAPTTILSEQHFMTVAQRLQPFGIRVACLNRFRNAKQTKAILEDLRLGRISVVVGTHRLLSKDCEFFDLGLLVLDEEQRFGVEHKERIKTLRNNVNVLSLSATPIPRTLHMALSGIRDVSLLDTPPKGRKPVETVVAEYSDAMLQDAIEKELNRGGQVFVLYNSVEKIFFLADKIRHLVPDATLVVGHGQMDTKELEGNIIKFYNKEAQILVATTIIENGIDVPNANTLFVVEANKLGLSQMYQLRGRVGRSERLATAYFTYPEGYVPEGDVQKRLNALTDAQELGSGYRLALMDLEIRGAGNILGREQHGHAMRIGYDTYCRLLKETIALLQGEVVVQRTETEVSASVDAYISETLVKSERERLKLYKRIAEIETPDDKERFESDFEELYGKLPVEVENLLRVSLIRVLGSKCGVEKAEVDSKYCRLRFVGEEYLESRSVKDALSAVKNICTYVNSGRLIEFFIKSADKCKKMDFLIKFLSFASGIYDFIVKK